MAPQALSSLSQLVIHSLSASSNVFLPVGAEVLFLYTHVLTLSSFILLVVGPYASPPKLG